MTAAGQERVEGVKVSHGRSRRAHWSTWPHRYVDGWTHSHLDNIQDYEEIHNLPRSLWYRMVFEFSGTQYSVPFSITSAVVLLKVIGFNG